MIFCFALSAASFLALLGAIDPATVGLSSCLPMHEVRNSTVFDDSLVGKVLMPIGFYCEPVMLKCSIHVGSFAIALWLGGFPLFADAWLGMFPMRKGLWFGGLFCMKWLMRFVFVGTMSLSVGILLLLGCVEVERRELSMSMGSPDFRSPAKCCS
ncbi:hypothetical protein Nepgr_028960 [Nepenthes gracilis]|uniref:NADH dehydrogenase subunit 6 n=1 Tax=Nepenthes gracilis TaxID=150966 RepID=A0AAD3Y2K4_NEPGR|nr:hypothetical protein Nepgr_028960 [Nepenthes gracilis]